MTSMIGKLMSPVASAYNSVSTAASGLMGCRKVKAQKPDDTTVVVTNAIKPLPFAPTRLTSDVYSIGFPASRMNRELATQLLDQNPQLQSVVFGEGEEHRVRRPKAIRVVVLDNTAVEEFDDNDQIEGLVDDPAEADTDIEEHYQSDREENTTKPLQTNSSSSDSDEDTFVDARRSPRKPRRKEVETIGPITSPMGGMKLRSREDLIEFNPLLKGRYFKRGDKLPLNAK